MESRLTAPVGAGNRDESNAIARLFLRLGLTAFGGPAAHIAMMETEVVTRRGWMTRAEFLDLLGVVQVLPGPNSTELAIHVGHARGGWHGGLIAGCCFVLPSVALVWLLALLSGAPGMAGASRTVLWWLAPMVVAVVGEALWKFGKQAAMRPSAVMVMPVTALAAVMLPSDLLVLLTGAVAAMLLGAPRTRDVAGAAGMAVVTLLGAGPLAAQVAMGGVAPSVAAIFLYFLRAGMSVFGSGYVLLAYLQRDLVTGRGWLTMDALLQASALAQVTPGPLFTTATAVGYAMGGSAGAMAATVGIFAPAFASVVVGAPVRRLLDRSPMARRALDGVVIASVALLGRAVVGFAMPLQAWQWALCLGAAVLLFAVRVSATWLLLASVLAGVAASVLHFSLS